MGFVLKKNGKELWFDGEEELYQAKCGGVK